MEPQTGAESEAQLVAASQAGDLAAFETLVRRYQRMIDALAYRMSGSQADAADLAQETFIRAYRQLHTFRAEAKFSSWLYRIGINTCLNWRKSAARRDRLHREFAEQPDTGPSEPDPRSARVQAALLQLPPTMEASRLAVGTAAVPAQAMQIRLGYMSVRDAAGAEICSGCFEHEVLQACGITKGNKL